MTVLEKIKTPNFIQKVLLKSGVFFVMLVVISLVLRSGSSVFTLDIDGVVSENFSDGKWKSFLGFKVIFSVLYSVFTVLRSIR